MKMEKLKRSLSFRKKKDHVPECSKPHQWQEDEKKVRDGTCSFQVRVSTSLTELFVYSTHKYQQGTCILIYQKLGFKI